MKPSRSHVWRSSGNNFVRLADGNADPLKAITIFFCQLKAASMTALKKLKMQLTLLHLIRVKQGFFFLFPIAPSFANFHFIAPIVLTGLVLRRSQEYSYDT